MLQPAALQGHWTLNGNIVWHVTFDGEGRVRVSSVGFAWHEATDAGEGRSMALFAMPNRISYAARRLDELPAIDYPHGANAGIMTPPTDASEGRDGELAASFRVQPANDRVARERTIKSVQHAIDILDLLAGPVRAGGVTGLAAALGMNVSTVHHLLRTLQARGLVEQDPESKVYRLGLRTLQLGDAYLLGLDPTTPARLEVRSPTAADNAQEIGWRKARAKPAYKMVFIQYQPHAVAAAWSHGIQDVAKVQGNVDYQLWDGRASVARQISLMRSAIKHGVDAIFFATRRQPGGLPIDQRGKSCRDSSDHLEHRLHRAACDPR